MMIRRKNSIKKTIFIDFWPFLKMPPKCQIVIANFELQKKYHRVPRSFWSRFLAKGQENLISLNLECRFQQFGRNWPFCIKKLKIFDVIFAEFGFPEKFVKVGSALQKCKQMSKILTFSTKSENIVAILCSFDSNMV